MLSHPGGASCLRSGVKYSKKENKPYSFEMPTRYPSRISKVPEPRTKLVQGFAGWTRKCFVESLLEVVRKKSAPYEVIGLCATMGGLVVHAIRSEVRQEAVTLWSANVQICYVWCPSKIISHTHHPGNDFVVPPPPGKQTYQIDDSSPLGHGSMLLSEG